jgi:glucokinase
MGSRNFRAIIGVDLGGTRLKIGLVDNRNKVVLLRRFLTRVDQGKEKVLKRIAAVIRDTLLWSRKKGYAVKAIGIGAPGMVDQVRGIIHISPNFPDWKDVPLIPLLAREIPLPLYLDNDANAITIGEKWAGAGSDLSNFACLTLGTGVGSGLFLNGRLWYGSQGSGPEIGHMTIQPGGERCGCGNRGCLETLASAKYMIKKAEKALAAGIAPLLAARLEGVHSPLSARLLYEAALAGDSFSLSLFRVMGRSLGIAAANLVHTMGLEGIILSGGVSRAATIFLPYLEKEFKKRLTLVDPNQVRIRISSLWEKSGVLGAACMAGERNKQARNSKFETNSKVTNKYCINDEEAYGCRAQEDDPQGTPEKTG